MVLLLKKGSKQAISNTSAFSALTTSCWPKLFWGVKTLPEAQAAVEAVLPMNIQFWEAAAVSILGLPLGMQAKTADIWRQKLAECRRVICSLIPLRFSPRARAIMVKAYALSKLWYIADFAPMPLLTSAACRCG